jgi:hypothetical protein
MASIPDFDLEDMLLALNPFIENHAEGSKEKEVFKLAQAALLYILHIKKEDDFRRYYSRFSETSFTVEVAHDFATREEADTWMASGAAQDSERVKIAGKGFMVVQVSGKLYFMVAPLPEELETAEWKDGDDDEDA